MSEKKKEYIVNGFVFHSGELAEKARREVEGIKFVRSKTDMENPGMVLRVYNRLVEQRMFETPVGVGYMRELQEYLLAVPAVPKEEILPIPVEEIIQSDFEAAGKKRKGIGASMIVNIILAAAMAVMVFLSLSSNLPTIINYENKLLDKYSAWEQELTEREKAVKIKERELDLLQEPGMESGADAES